MDREHGTRFHGFSVQFLVYSSLFDYMTTCFKLFFLQLYSILRTLTFLRGQSYLQSSVAIMEGRVITIFFERIQSVLAKQQ